jgi:hypothetical protein
MKFRKSIQRSVAVFCIPTIGLLLSQSIGCSESGPTPSGNTITELPPETDGHEGHAHPSEGPHHGDLVELGNEEFHAEVVHGDAGSVTVYILDSSAKTAVPIDATELAINISNYQQNAKRPILKVSRPVFRSRMKNSPKTLMTTMLRRNSLS